MFKSLQGEFREGEERWHGGRERLLSIRRLIWLYVALMWFVYLIGLLENHYQ